MVGSVGHNAPVVDPALTLGAAAVKAACKIWLKDKSIAADVSTRLVDIIEAKVEGGRERRKVKRTFEELEETVADKILAVLGHEFRNLSENERTAAVLAVAATFDDAQLTNSDLFAADLDPLYLERQLRSSNPHATRDLSESGTVLYDRVLGACSAYVVEVSATLPRFQVGAFSAVLERQSELLARVRELLDRMPTKTETQVATFETAYRQLVARQLDRLELFGVTLSRSLQSYELNKAYVTLTVSSPRLQRRLSEYNSGESVGVVTKQPQSAAGPLPIDVALSATSRLFLRGEAGSGKTTLLQWLAVHSSRRNFSGALGSWSDTVPFLIRLRGYANRPLPTPEEFLNQLGRHIADGMPTGWVHENLRTGRALVLVDGVDELPASQRPIARSWLRELIDSFPEARYVVSSRPAAATSAWLDQDGFDDVQIQPMNESDISVFARHWHAALAEGSVDPEERARIEYAEHDILTALRSQRHLRQLATSPLLAALICALHLDRRTQLPRDRMELYSIALEMLLERRDIERQIATSTISMARADKLVVLQDLAYRLIRNGWTDVASDRVIERFREHLVTMPRIQASANQVYDELLTRSGLLREPVVGRINFVHRTFQEYLAARAVVDVDDIGVLVQNAHDDQWHEVVVMAAGHAQLRQRNELLAGILERAQNSQTGHHTLEALAVACLQTSTQLDPSLTERLKRVASLLLPPRTLGEAEAMAKSGDLALDLFTASQITSARKAASSIRMASLVGGERALDVIEECVRRGGPRSQVIDEAKRAWERFDVGTYAQQVMRLLPHDVLEVENPSILSALRHLEVRYLNCRFQHGHGRLGFVADVPTLEYLDISIDPELTDLRPLANHPSLKSLSLGVTGPVDLRALRRCTNLRSLDISMVNVSDPFAVRGLPGLRQLQVNDLPVAEALVDMLSPECEIERVGLWKAGEVVNLETFTALPQLSSLEFLLLGQASKLETLAGIQRWARTMTGAFVQAPNLRDAGPLGSLPKLTFLNLARTPISSVEFVRQLPELELLHVGDGRSVPDLSPIVENLKINQLFLWTDRGVDLTPLAGRENITIEIVTRLGRGRVRGNVRGRELLGRGSRVRYRSS
jgi:hypothetical protein